MTGMDLKSARTGLRWTQAEAAHRLRVTQAYLSMVERGTRPVSDELASAICRVFPLPATARTLISDRNPLRREDFLRSSLSELGYPGFAYLKLRISLNPAELFLLALDSEDLDARVMEALPWVPFHYSDLDWAWLSSEAKLRDRQNRLAYVTALAKDVAVSRDKIALAGILNARMDTLERSRLAKEDTLCKASLSEAERKWLRSHRPSLAAHWNLLTDLQADDLQHVSW